MGFRSKKYLLNKYFSVVQLVIRVQKPLQLESQKLKFEM